MAPIVTHMPSFDILSTRETAESLNVGVRDVQRLIAGGRLTPITKLPGKTGAYLFNRSDVEALAKGGAK